MYLFLLLLTCCATHLNGWTHLELGAGNYGADGHTQASQAKTVLLKLMRLSDKVSYIDALEKTGRGDYLPEKQYAVLFWTLDELVKRYGNVGVFHVNDLYDTYALFAAEKLKNYAALKGYEAVIIEALSGDYRELQAEKTLSKYGKDKYDSAHLKNPEISFYYDFMDGDDLYASAEAREQTRLLLNKLAQLSETGLYLFILDHHDFIPLKERIEYIDKGLFYCRTTVWTPLPYIFPEGNLFEEATGIVFHIRGDKI